MRTTVLLVLLLFSPLAHADDKEAIRLYTEATKNWNDPDPSKVVKFAEGAVEAANSKKIKLNALLLLGRVHSARTGDLDAALAAYEELIASVSSVSKRDRAFDGLKSDALLSKGNILFAERDDLKGALESYHASYEIKPSAANTDVLSQVLLRLAWPARDDAEGHARGDMEKALSYATESVHHETKSPKQRANALAKYRLQVVIVLTALAYYDEARATEAAKAWGEVDASSLDVNSYYQQAQLAALQKKPGEAVAAHLRAAMKERPTVMTRNQLRNFVRKDPFFAPFREAESWKDLVTDEPDAGK